MRRFPRFLACLAFGCAADGHQESSDSILGTASTPPTESSGHPPLGETDSGDEDPPDWRDRPLRDQVKALDDGSLMCATLVDAYLARMDERDEEINAMLGRDPDAKSEARQRDDSIGQGMPLHCAVVALKDNIDHQGTVTSAGSLALANNRVDVDAPVVQRMRHAGAIIIGKTNLSEWANFRGHDSTSGWSSLGGQTRNGAVPDYNPCGSSSGSAAAVAAGMVSAAIGTETNGSITCPASINGVVGFKPTVGLVSRRGIVPISHSQDTAGPLTKTVGDAARLLSIMAGSDPSDAATEQIPPDLSLDFERGLSEASFVGARVGIIDATGSGFDDATVLLYQKQLRKLEVAGAELVTVALPNAATFNPEQLTILTYEFRVGLNAYLASHAHPEQPSTLAELIAFNQARAGEVMPYFGQELLERSEATTGLTTPEYLVARQLAHTSAGPDGISATIAGFGLDVIIAPTTDPAWITDYESGDQTGASSGSAAAVAGYPHLSVPMGTVDEGRPVGLSFIGEAWHDGQVLGYGFAYEQLGRKQEYTHSLDRRSPRDKIAKVGLESNPGKNSSATSIVSP